MAVLNWSQSWSVISQIYIPIQRAKHYMTKYGNTENSEAQQNNWSLRFLFVTAVTAIHNVPQIRS